MPWLFVGFVVDLMIAELGLCPGRALILLTRTNAVALDQTVSAKPVLGPAPGYSPRGIPYHFPERKGPIFGYGPIYGLKKRAITT